MEMQKTKEFAKEWIDTGKPCIYRFGFKYRGAIGRRISQEEALNLLPKYSFGMGFYELDFIKENGETVLEFNELGENDLW